MSYDDMLEPAVALTRQTGDYIKKEGEGFDREDIELKGYNDLVSYVDKEAEKKLVEGLSNLLPEAGFITEEGTVEQVDKALQWVIDPLDGTTNFLHGLPFYSVSVALLENGRPVLGIVYEPVRKECFTATISSPARCNGKEIHISGVGHLKDSLLATGFPYYNFERMDAYLHIIHHFMEHTHGLRRMGSAALDLVYVACGRFEGFFEYNLKPWDVAAGALILEKAGGKSTDFSGGDQFIFGKQIIAAGKVHAEMVEVIEGIWNS